MVEKFTSIRSSNATGHTTRSIHTSRGETLQQQLYRWFVNFRRENTGSCSSNPGPRRVISSRDRMEADEKLFIYSVANPQSIIHVLYVRLLINLVF